MPALLIPALAASTLALLLVPAPAQRADVKNAVMIPGDGVCAKCKLKKAPFSKNVLMPECLHRWVLCGGRKLSLFLGTVGASERAPAS